MRFLKHIGFNAAVEVHICSIVVIVFEKTFLSFDATMDRGVRGYTQYTRLRIFDFWRIPNVKYFYFTALKITRKPNKTYLTVHWKKLL
jgi:hypothetical protein